MADRYLPPHHHGPGDPGTDEAPVDRRSSLRRQYEKQRERKIATAFLVLWVSGIVGLYVLEKRDIHRQETSSFYQCRRVNEVREGSNRNSLLIYRVLYDAYIRESKLARKDKNTKSAHAKSANKVQELLPLLEFQPYTDCSVVKDHPATDAIIPRHFDPGDLKTDPTKNPYKRRAAP